jgi:hypothetical protein
LADRNLFRKANIDAIKDKFVTTVNAIKSAGISLDTLDENISDYYSGKELSEARNAEQQKIFDEFLKYAKMAEFSFKLTQATNYDTTKFKSGDTLFKKQTRTDAAREMNIFSSVDKILDNTFIGEQAYLLDRSAESLGEILKLEQDEFTIITNSVLKSYAENEYLSADKSEKIANKLKASFLDYIIQIKSGINTEIKELLVEKGKSVADKLAAAKKDHPEVTILKDLKVESSDRADGAKTIKLAANIKEAYDENYYTGLMREMRDNPATKDLYYDIVNLSLLQGTYQSAVSIKNIIPIEDFSDSIAPIISTLVADTDVQAFSEGWFQRNNWKDSDIWKTMSPRFFPQNEGIPIGEDAYGNEVYLYTSIPYFPNIKDFDIKSSDRRILTLSETFNFLQVNADYILVPRVIKQGDDQIDMKTGQTITPSMFAQRKAKGDLSLKEVFGYKKVKFDNGEPLTFTAINYKGDTEVKHVYKLINLYGDGQLASEYYLDFQPSVLDNGTVKIANEITDADIINYFAPRQAAEQKEVVPLKPTPQKYTPEERLEAEIIDITQKIELLKEAQEYTNDISTEMIVLNNLVKITPESAKKETGLKTGTSLDISLSFLNKNGVSVEKAAEIIWQEYFIDTNIDSQDVRNIIIDILSAGTKANYIAQFGGSREVNSLKQELKELKEDLVTLNKGTVKPVAPSGKGLNTTSGKLKLKDGKEYLISDINAELLQSIGYKPKDIGKLLKSIC